MKRQLLTGGRDSTNPDSPEAAVVGDDVDAVCVVVLEQFADVEALGRRAVRVVVGATGSDHDASVLHRADLFRVRLPQKTSQKNLCKGKGITLI